MYSAVGVSLFGMYESESMQVESYGAAPDTAGPPSRGQQGNSPPWEGMSSP